MSIDLARLPDDIAIGALISYTFDTAKNPSESGIKGRKSMRSQVIRNYTVSIAPGESAEEFQSILLSVLGDRYPFAMRDPTSFNLSDEPLTDFTTVGGSTHVPLYKTFTPVTGSRSYRQRILIPDITEVPLVFSLNGSPVTPTFTDPGIAIVGSVLTGGDDLRIVSGQYLTPVCIADTAAATINSGPYLDAIFGFQEVRFEEILENELVNLTS